MEQLQYEVLVRLANERVIFVHEVELHLHRSQGVVPFEPLVLVVGVIGEEIFEDLLNN